MVNSCSAFGCTNKFVKNGPKAFHKFPLKDKELCKKWVIALKRENFTPTKYSCICSDHFSPNAYNFHVPDKDFSAINHVPRLKYDAVPSIFVFSKEKQSRKMPFERKPLKRKMESSSSPPLKKSKVDTLIPVSSCRDSTVHQTENDSPPSSSSAAASPTKQKLLKKIKTLQQKLRRKEKKINSMKDTITNLKDKKLVNDDVANILQQNFSGLTREIISNKIHNNNVKPKGHRYNDEIKRFALTLHFYSPRAYNFLQPILSLPVASSISHWTSSVNCEPGLFEDVIQYLGKKKETDENFRYCALMIDAMAIKNSIIYDKTSGSYVGFSNYGENLMVCEPDSPATEALVFMLVGLRGHWKTPIGYILCNKIKAINLTSFIESILKMTSLNGLKVKSITFDGANVNFNSVAALGCKFGEKVSEFISSFKHGDELIYVIPDVCHMLKLARNALSSLGVFIDGKGQYVKWEFVNSLFKLQEMEGLKLANKLSKKHIEFQRHKMNVKVAAQTLSSSVADAIEYLMHCQHPSFQGAEGTILFIRTIDKLFDMLNSKSPFGKGFKKPLRLGDQDFWQKSFDEAITYLSKLTDFNGTPLLKHRRKTFVLGLITASKSIVSLSQELLTLPENPFKYVLSYKFSQDHLELLFACIRGRNGFNNNPDVLQLKSSLKKILVRNSIVGSRHANCLMFEEESNGSIFSLKWSKRASPIQGNEIEMSNEISLQDISIFYEQHIFSHFKDSVLGYISGFIARKLILTITCHVCANAMINTNNNVMEHCYAKSSFSLVSFKNRGGLVMPSTDVISVVRICEQVFNFHVSGSDFENPKVSGDKNLKLKLMCTVNKIVLSKKLFSQLDVHDLESAVRNEDLHSTQIIKKIAEKFFTIRLLRYGQDYTEKVLRKSSIGLRQQTNKMLLFKGL